MTTYTYNNEGSPTTLVTPSSLKQGDVLKVNRTGSGRTGTILSFTVPYTGYYRIKAVGARSGIPASRGTFGRGASMRGDFLLKKGEVLQLLVGQTGGSNSYAGGGGGTFVAKGSSYTNASPLIVAGGGGASGEYSPIFTQSLSDASTSSNGNNGTGDSKGLGQTSDYTASKPGTGYCPGAGGGGFYVAGGNTGTTTATGGRSFREGGAGGLDTTGSGGTVYVGGFGGGGGSYDAGGGGGGYRGGGGGGNSASTSDGSGGGGGSYNAGTNQSNVAGVGTTDGYIEITYYNLVTAPNKPSTITTPQKSKVGKPVTISWSSVPLPSQEGVTLDNQTVYYRVDIYNGSSWVTVADAVAAPYATITVPQMSDTDSAKVRVHPYVLSGGQRYYSDGNTESFTFTIYNNNTPTVSSDIKLSVTEEQEVKPLEKVNIQFTLGTDEDIEDKLTGYIDFWNGTEWIVIAKDLVANEGVVSFTHLIPAKAVIGAKYKVYTFDDTDFGPTLESYTFNVSEPDSSRKLPNMLELDGVDDYLEIPNNTAFNVNGSNVSVELLFQSSQPPKSGTSTMVFGKEGSMWFELRDNGTVDFFVTTSDGVKGVGSLQSVTDGLMKRLSATYDGTTIRMYINGVLVNSIEHTGTLVDNTKPYTVGKPINDSSVNPFNSQFLTGKVGSFRVFNTVRTQEEIDANKMTEIPKETSGLTLYPQFDAETGKIICSKTGTAGEINGGATWGYSFVPVTEVILPSSLVAGRKENLDYLRIKVAEFRKANGLPAVTWTDATIVKGVTPIKAVHLNEMTQAIRETYTLTGQVIKDSEVKEVIEEEIVARDNRFLISDMNNRFDMIVRALVNK